MLAAPRRPLSALIERWRAGRLIYRVHLEGYGPLQFNRSGTGSARFSPIVSGDRVVPTLYGAATVEAALWETVFHDIDTHQSGRKQVLRSHVDTLRLSTLNVQRPLKLARLHSTGLHRLGVDNRDLIESGSSHHALTRQWAVALYEDMPDIDGLVWMSRRYNSRRALMLFGDRAAHLGAAGPPVSLTEDAAAWKTLLKEARAAEIAIV